jgi:hypothetical protein
MPKNTNRLTKRQRTLLDDLFTGLDNQQQALEKHKISASLYNRWLTEENFAAEYERRLHYARRQGELLIARYSSVAAAKLIELTQSANGETSRKACLDIITLLRPDSAPVRDGQAHKPDADTSQENADTPCELPPDLASRLLAALVADPPNGQASQPAK